MFKGLVTLIRERFPLYQYSPMILLFGLGNGLYFYSQKGLKLSSLGLVLSLLILFSSFLRLRFFDEIKDLETDIRINPTRPLARGAVSVPQVKSALLLLIIFEIVLSFLLNPAFMLIQALVIGYSLLMYEEFFIGDFLRPHLTTYAVVHTFSSVLMAFMVAEGAVGGLVLKVNSHTVAFLLANWMFFNIFEFARKTFADSEEREGVDTYSSLFGIRGAVALSFSQVVMGCALLGYSLENQNLILVEILAGLYAILGIVFIIKPNVKMAKVFRNLSGLYLLLHYAALISLLGKGLL